MKKRAIVAILLVSVICFNSIANLGVAALENTMISNTEDQNGLKYSNAGVSTLATEDEIEKESDDFRYVNSNGSVVSYTLTYREETGLIYTPNGTDASDLSLTDNKYYTVTFIDEHHEGFKTYWTNWYSVEYPNAEYISEATSSYNCHSYAWYSQNVSTNNVWLNLPNIYYDTADMSYKQVDSPQIGDIICYFDLDLPEEYQNIHSGIVVGFSGETSNNVCGDSNTVIVRSKWGHMPLFEHIGDECPYILGNPTVAEDDADEVRYYRPRTNASYTLSSSMNDLSISRTVNGSGLITNKYGMYELNVASAGQYTITIQSDHALSNRLYNVNMNLMSMTSPASSTGTYTYTTSLSAGRYYLRTAYSDTTNSGTISITIEPHSHSYDWWTYYNSTTHIESCCCGLTRTATAVHSIRASEVVNNKANCMGCGYMLDLRYDVAVSIPDGVVKVSVNGSYILPSGIIVLVDEDVEAYLNGTLVFYDKDDLPVTQ